MELFAALAATWPPAETVRLGPWTLRRGAGGGNRVSAATLDGPLGDVAAAEAAMARWDQEPLFMLRPGDAALDAALAVRGYAMRDPTGFLAAPVASLLSGRRGETAILCEAPLAVMREIWARSGVGPDRLAVMDRVAGPRIWLLGRTGDRPVGCAFAAIHGTTVMLHALEVAPAARRRGLGAALTRAAADWAAGQGAERLALAVTEANTAARALYAGLGMAAAGSYHYRVPPAGS